MSETENTQTKSKLFSEIVPSINKKSGNVIESGSVTESMYGSLMQAINLVYSMGSDTILLANEMNLRPYINRKAHYDFYYYGIPKKPFRYNDWAKKTTNPDLENIKYYFKVSEAKAKDYLKILSDEDLKQIKKELSTIT